ncbi:hypothetical protein CVIRNUC_008700 [Coccomyxa viridis]|uniref:Protein kinase domain-containing protein n=1 Tax=Coccomyxa viridis TaxID=1274662 RepID=A0AAV1IDP0_9CHLO|nr:hypothetical protein CVIRNUC_008700 [Coccomyxa viridis]
MAPGSSFENPLTDHPKYVTLKYLSEGSFGFVVLAKERTTGKQVAIKFMERTEGKMTKNVERELLNHSMLIHPHVVRFEECFLTDKHLAIVMEYAAGGNLFTHVTANNGLKEDHARFFFQQIIVAIDYCHKMKVSNRDIKLENTLFDSSQKGRNPLIKLCDFGYSINEENSKPKTAVGTPGYTAPEVLKSRQYDAKLADIWSAGVMLFTMLCCSYPFERKEDDDQDPRTQTKIMQRILKADYKWPSSRRVSSECKDLVSKILVVDASKRITVQGIQEHPWFQTALPGSLTSVDEYNAHYVELSKAPDLLVSRESIKSVMQEARGLQPGQAAPSDAASDPPKALDSLELDDPLDAIYEEEP